jgi:GAF domain-containing protein
MFELQDAGLGPISYEALLESAKSLMHGERDRVANAANLSSLLYHTLPDLNWVGFYFFDGKELVVGPFQGKPACIRIPLDKGVCGAAARTRTTQRIDDVHAFAGHIACDSASNSELVIPLLKGNELIGVLDIDSPKFERFSAEDQAGMERIAAAYLAEIG